MRLKTIDTLSFRGLPAVRWRSADGASAIATLQGAHLVSWIPAGGEECLYLSERSPFEPGQPIRGGIPVVFPQFAELGPLEKHGFARRQTWRLTDTCLALEGSRRLELTVTIGGARLDVRLHVANAGAAPFSFAAALHTYLRVSDAAAVRLEGLRGTRYLDRQDGGSGVEAREVVTADEPIDRVYVAAPPATRLVDAGRILRIEQRGFTDTVVWNPGRERTAAMPDMPPDGYRHMLCVEAATIDPPVVLAPGATWSGGQSLLHGLDDP